MCSIVGIQGRFLENDIITLLKATKNRGPDSTGVFLDDELFLDIDLDNFSHDKEHNIGLGHNLLSAFDLDEKDETDQPLTSESLVLVYNGEIYNFKELKDKFHEEAESDSQLLLKILEDFYDEENDLLKAVEKTTELLDGDYSFAVYDHENLAITRDPIGIKPLFYGKLPKGNAFSSTKYSLKQLNIEDIKTLEPGGILYNWSYIPPKAKIAEKQFTIDGDIKQQLEDKLKKAVEKRVQYIDEVSVIFSGGVDSTILTMLLKEISEKRKLKIKLYAVGSEDSKDVIASKKIAEELNLPLKIQPVTEKIVKENMEDVVKLVGENNLMKIGVGMTIYLASKMIREDGGRIAISGQGADELFGGYTRYLKSYKTGELDDELRHDIEHMYHVNLERDDAVSMGNSVELRLPFLDKDLIEFALNIPVDEKIASDDDKIRKNILRDLGHELGLSEEFAYRPKKAAQYGTGIDKILRKKVLKEIDIEKFL